MNYTIILMVRSMDVFIFTLVIKYFYFQNICFKINVKKNNLKNEFRYGFQNRTMF